MSAFELPSFTAVLQTNGTSTYLYRPFGGMIPAIAVAQVKALVEIHDKTTNWRCQFAWRVYNNANSPGPWQTLGNVYSTNDTFNCTGLIDLSANSTLNDGMWVEFGIGVSNSTGSAVESAWVRATVTGRG
jgi:hypothetical protein